MARGINRDAWGKVFVRREDHTVDLDATIAAMKAAAKAEENDQEKIGETLHTIFQEMSKREYLPSSFLLDRVCARVAGDELELYNVLRERTKIVLDRDFKVERALGVVNPYHVKETPATAAE